MSATVAVTLVRLAQPRARLATYIAIAAEHALDVMARGPALFAETAASRGLDPADFDIDTVSWETMPGIRPVAALQVAGQWPPVVFLGTVEDDQWMSWYLPAPKPPVPPHPRSTP